MRAEAAPLTTMVNQQRKREGEPAQRTLLAQVTEQQSQVRLWGGEGAGC